MSDGLSRRQLVGRGAALAGGLAAARLLAACGGSSATTTPLPDMADLSRALRGRLIVPEERGYDAARLVWNSRFDGAHPVAIAQAADAGDVRTAIDYARAHGVRLIPRGGAHSFAGYSTGEGLVLDLSRLDRVEVDRATDRARIGGGATLLPVYRSLWRHKRAIAGGTCPTVGVAGLTAGGGLGVLSRGHGVTCDRLVDVEIVTADGRLRHASDPEDQELFWATQGGGGGNFGVITAMVFALVAVDMPFTSATYTFPWRSAVRVLRAWQQWLPTLSLRGWSAVQLITQAPRAEAEPTVEVELVYAGAENAARSAARELIAGIGVKPVSSNVSSGPFLGYERDAYCRGLRPDECELADKSAAGQFPRLAFYAKSDVARGPWPDRGLEVLVDAVERRQADRTLTPRNFSSTHSIGKVLIEAADGQVNAVPPKASAFVHRDNLFVAQFQSRWRHDAPENVVAANLDWANALYADAEPYRSGFAYQDYIDRDLADWEHAYYGANLEALRRIKAKYDPRGFFRFPQSVPPASPSDA